jgi:hypothetical protein
MERGQSLNLIRGGASENAPIASGSSLLAHQSPEFGAF